MFAKAPHTQSNIEWCTVTSIFRKLSVIENILLVLEAVGCPKGERKDRAMQLLAELGRLPDALITTSYVLLQGVFDVLQTRPADSRSLHLGTFGDNQLLDFLPLPVNAMAQQHGLMAETALRLALAAVEKQDYAPGVHAVARTFKQRIFKG